MRLLSIEIEFRCRLTCGRLVYRNGLNDAYVDFSAYFQIGTRPSNLFVGGVDDATDREI